jgi:hypothetical protein
MAKGMETRVTKIAKQLTTIPTNLIPDTTKSAITSETNAITATTNSTIGEELESRPLGFLTNVVSTIPHLGHSWANTCPYTRGFADVRFSRPDDQFQSKLTSYFIFLEAILRTVNPLFFS